MNGTDFLILADSDGMGAYLPVASQREAQISETNQVRDLSTKSARERKVAAGRYEATVEFSGLYVPTDAAFVALRTAMRAGTPIRLRMSQNGTDVEEATAVITDMTRDFPDQEEATIALQAAIDGAFTILP